MTGETKSEGKKSKQNKPTNLADDKLLDVLINNSLQTNAELQQHQLQVLPVQRLVENASALVHIRHHLLTGLGLVGDARVLWSEV